jgi:uncharacterized membrane protein YdjX (TVP38/TMEM64 family)
VNGTNFAHRRKAIGLAILGIALIFVFASVLIARGVSIADVVTFARSLRRLWWMPLAYVAAYAVLDLLCIPPQLLSIIAPIVWGWAAGGTIELIAAILGAIPPYLIARSAFRGAVEKRMGDQRVDSFSLLLLFRLVPVIPYSILNYVAGLSAITPAHYVMATAIGIVPSTYIFAYFVDAVVAGVMRPSEVFVRVMIAGAVLAAFVIAIRLLARVVRPPAQAAARDREAAPRDAADLEPR